MDRARATELSRENVKQFLDSVDTFLLDCDGVLWQGSSVISGVPETLGWLRSLGKRLFFVTNNSRSSRREYKAKIEKFGIAADTEEIFSSSFAAAAFLQSKNFDQKVYVIGGPGIAEELNLAGISSRGVDEHARLITSVNEVQSIQLDPEIGAVVVGLDFSFCYYKIAFALRHLQANSGCLFVATNSDDTLPIEGGLELPGGGTMVSALQTCSRKQPTIVGKPNQEFLDLIVSTRSLNRSRTVMVGDKLSTDILFGNMGDIRTLLVFTGVTKPDEVHNASSGHVPEFTLPKLPDLLELIKLAPSGSCN